jgi:fermentation-respiration switch protein FrsA (DUF1100 family)
MTPLPSLEGFAKGTFSAAVGLTSVALSLAYYGQEYLIYPSSFPPGSREECTTPDVFHIPYEDVTLVTEDNVKVKAYLMLQRRVLPADSTGFGFEPISPIPIPAFQGDDDAFMASRPTVLIFHANAGNFGHRLPFARVFYNMLRCNVFMLSYRGYGPSEGTPSEKGIRMDAQASLDYILNHPKIGSTRKLVYGQSLGGAVCIDLTSRNPDKVHGLILENTFLSIPRLIPSVMPLLGPFSFLCHQRWNSADALPLIPQSTPLLMLSGLEDEVVPPSHMKDLWEIASANGEKGRTFIEFATGKHNDTCIKPKYWDAVRGFIEDFTNDNREAEKE